MVAPQDLQIYLEENIPLSRALGVRVNSISQEQLVLSAPFDKNINHKRTVFGGSLHAVATLACWGMIYSRLKDLASKCPEIVITKSDVSYLKPVTKDFTVVCQGPSDVDWQRFLKILHRHKKARLTLSAFLVEGGKECLVYKGTFAVLT